MSEFRNIFACLVHENQACVVDLVRNLRCLDPSSVVLLYNGGQDPDLLNHGFPFERYGAVVHPSPRPLAWGRLHDFAVDCMKFAAGRFAFDTLTIVDSDQLAVRPSYSDCLSRKLAGSPKIGVLGNAPYVQAPHTRVGPAEAALKEIDLWRPFLRRFPHGEEKFVYWCFWPSTVFTADAARDLVPLFAADHELREILDRTRIWASEEVILPTLAALLGYEVAANPCSYEYVRYRAPYTLAQIDAAVSQPDVYWIHPVPRIYDDPIRKHIRERLSHYENPSLPPPGPAVPAATPNGGPPPLLLTLPILQEMRRVEGWLDEDEADLLIAVAARAAASLPRDAAFVEVGSYCGRATVVLGGVLKALGADCKVHAIDPHDGKVGSLDSGMEYRGPTLDRFQANIHRAGVVDYVESIAKNARSVVWDKPVWFLLIDGLHDYSNVASDFYHFERSLLASGYVAFHDYAGYYPGVVAFVNEILASGCYEKVHCVRSMIVLRKLRDLEAHPPPDLESRRDVQGVAADIGLETQAPAPAAILSGQPLVSCIMPTADRRVFVPHAIRYFLRQKYPNRELIILDDGSDPVADLIPPDPRIRYHRMEQRRTMGAKHNMACELARGEIIAHWDDDDWTADWRLDCQVEELLKHPPMTLCGLSRLLFFNPTANRAWEYAYPAAERPWVCGNTFCYRKTFWDGHRFPDMNEGADTVYVWGLHDAKVLPLADHRFLVAIVHSGNTSPKKTDGFCWQTLPAEEIRQLLSEDWQFYQSWGH